jgi:hypothetical protein
MLEIRFAQPADKESILRIYLSATQVSQPDTYWDQLIRAEQLLVAQLNDRIIGFGGIDVTAGEQLKWLYLLPEHQRARRRFETPPAAGGSSLGGRDQIFALALGGCRRRVLP